MRPATVIALALGLEASNGGRPLFGTRTKEDEDSSYMLDRVRAELTTDGIDHELAIAPVADPRAYLDQFVAHEAAIQFRQQRGRDPSVTDAQNRSQVVGASAERTALGGG